MRLTAVIWLALALVAACASPGATPQAPSGSPATSPLPSETPAPSATAAPARPHVFVIVMENASLARALAAPPVATLASTYRVATNYHAVARPSLPNYLALTSGSTWDVTDNEYRVLPAGGIGAQLSAAGVPWRAYMEGLTADGCLNSPYPYAVKHNPFAYYGGECPQNVVPLDELDADLAAETPQFVWISPGLCHDGHDCSLAEAGTWLAQLVERIVASPSFHEKGALFVVWDEGDGGDDTNLVPLIVVTPNSAPRRSAELYDHYSLLATIEDTFGLPRLGAAAGARSLTDLLSLRRP
jgi:phosphatidylinositol-3-phosphatase